MVKPIEFGTMVMAQENVIEFAKRSEALGYDVLACGEHVMFHGPITNGYVSLAAAAGATETLKLMSAITLLPLYPATLAAKLGAALDVVSGGRFMFGVGVGGEFPREFEACGVPVKERGARTDEALALIRRLWSEENVNFDGRFTTVSDFTISPAPVSDPYPPIWVAGRQAAAMRRSAQHGDGWMPYMYTPEHLADSVVSIAAQREKFGRPVDGHRFGMFLWSAVHEDSERAVQSASEMLSENYNQDFSKLVGKYALAGNPEQCQARIQEYVDAGADLVILAPALKDPTEAERSSKLMAEAVMPAFKAV